MKHLTAFRNHVPIVLTYVAARRHISGNLLDDPDALAHLLHPHQVARIAVALRSRGNLEFVIFITRVGHLFPKVPIEAAGAQIRPADSPSPSPLRGL